jgi:transcriptional regulator with XRE-family HTH domain
MGTHETVAIADLSPMAWRLLRVAAGYGQRDVERELDVVQQANVSMLESGTRGLSVDRRERLFELYAAELTSEQIEAIAANF